MPDPGPQQPSAPAAATSAPAPPTPVAAAAPASLVVSAPTEPQLSKHRAKPAPVTHVKAARIARTPLGHSAVARLLAQPKLASTSAPLAPRAEDFVPQQGVTLVPNSAVPVGPSDAGKPKMLGPPKAPTWPPAPSTPSNDTPGSLGGALNGPVGGALLLFAAIAAVLSIMPPWLTVRVATAVAAPVEWRRRLSLERPG